MKKEVKLVILTETVLQDLRYAVRLLYRNPGYTALAVIALALGIGVNTAVFTAYRAMVARRLDARNPGEMVNLALIRDSGAAVFNFSYPDYEAYRDSARSFSSVIACSFEHMTLGNAGGVISQRSSAAGSPLGKLGLLSSGASNTEFASVFVVSENYFKVLGVGAMRGQTIDSMSVSQLVSSPSALMSENYWEKRFARDPAMLGKTISLNGIAVTIAGITPRNFVGTGVVVPDFWLPLSLEPQLHADDHWLHDREHQRLRLFARLAPGVSMNQARAEITLLADHLRTLHDPNSDSAKPASVLLWPGSPFPLPLYMFSGLKLSILLIMTAAGMVLSVACANVSSLQLARARSRHNELCTRVSLGASRVRVIRQLLTESALLALLAGAVALLFTWAFLQVAVTLVAEAFPAELGTLVFHVTPDLKIFAYVFAISLVAGILFGLAPAMESSRGALFSAAKAGTATGRSRRTQDVLIATQVALSLAILIAAGTFIRSAVRALKMETGYESKRVIDLEFSFPETSKYSSASKLALIRELRTRLAAVPGVAAITSAKPPDDVPFRTTAVTLDGGEPSARNTQSILSYTYVEANYFHALNIPVFLGHGFEARTGQTENSLILSESAAKQLWPGQNSIGRRLRLGAIDERFHNRNELVADGPAYQVIGVARDTRGIEFDGSDSKKVYLPVPEDRLDGRPILIRVQSNPAEFEREIDAVISSTDPNLVTTTSTLDELLHQTAPFIVSSLVAGVALTVGLFGLLLASMGIYGTVSYIVALRTREIGIRMAVGAQKHDILGLILRESMRPVVGGLFVGILLAIGFSYVLRGLLYGVNTVDGMSFAGVSVLFLAIALLAAYPPSRRALQVDPVVALRYE
jgi:predicted permease